MKTQHKIIISVFAVLAAVAGIILILQKPERASRPLQQNSNHANTSQEIFPPTVFDGRLKIPLTDISVSYPTKGFYGIPVKFIPYNMGNNLYGVTGGIGIVQSAPIDKANISEFISITLDVRKADKNENLNGLIKSLNDSAEPEYQPNGTTETIDNNVFYIVKYSNEQFVVYGAYTQINNQFFHLEFQYPLPSGAINKATADNNEKLFYDYLSDLRIEENGVSSVKQSGESPISIGNNP